MTPLHKSLDIDVNDTEAVKYLYKSPFIDRNLKDNIYRKWALFHYAATTNNADALKYVCSIPDINFNTKDSIGWTPLLQACHYSNSGAILYVCTMKNVDILSLIHI